MTMTTTEPEIWTFDFRIHGPVQIFADTLRDAKPGKGIYGPSGFLGHLCDNLTDWDVDGLSEEFCAQAIKGDPVGKLDIEYGTLVFGFRRVFHKTHGPVEQVLKRAVNGKPAWINWPLSQVMPVAEESRASQRAADGVRKL